MGKRSPSPDIEKGTCTKHPPRPRPPFPPPTPKQWTPWLVPIIFLANIGMFIYTMYVNDCPSYTVPDQCLLYDHLGRFSFQPFKENAAIGPSIVTLEILGALDPIRVQKHGEAWRFFSCMWLHAGVIHLFINMMSLLFIGIPLEQEFGFLKIGGLYLMSGFGGSLMSALNPVPSISVGASGALFGLLGSMLSELFMNWTIYVNKCKAVSSLLLIIGLNLAFGLIPRVDNSAHIGGFLAGFFLGFILLMRPQYGYISRRYIPAGYDIKMKPKHKCYQYLLLITALVVIISGYLYGLDMFYSGRRLQLPSISFTI